jgi:large conductance mechanosensitive channel
MLEEFKKFAMRGNVVDLAVGVIIGVAFGAIVTSLVNDIIMPLIGGVTGGLDFSNYYTALSSKVQSDLPYADAKKQGAVLGWGQFLTTALNFLIVAWVLFMAVKGINKLKKEEAAPPPSGPTPEVKLLAEIRDLLKNERPARIIPA